MRREQTDASDAAGERYWVLPADGAAILRAMATGPS